VLCKHVHVHYFFDALQLHRVESSGSTGSQKTLPPSPVNVCEFAMSTRADFTPPLDTLTLSYRDVVKLIVVLPLPFHVLCVNMEAFMTHYSLAFHHGAQPAAGVRLAAPANRTAAYTYAYFLHNVVIPGMLMGAGFLLGMFALRF
jgi:hypothetical protein